MVAGRVTDLREGVAQAAAAIDDGRAARLLDRAREALGMSDRRGTGSVLDAILARTRERVAAEQGRSPLDASNPAVRQAPPVRPFGEALGPAG